MRLPSTSVPVRPFRQTVGRHSEHAAGPAGRIEQGVDDARVAQRLVVLDEQEVGHEPDHFTGSEVLPGRLVGLLGEAPDQLFVDLPHVPVVHPVRVKVEVGEPATHLVQEVALLGAGSAARTGTAPTSPGPRGRRHGVRPGGWRRRWPDLMPAGRR